MSSPEAPGRSHVRRTVLIVGLLGLALSTGIIVYVGFDKTAAAFAKIGWRGLLAMCAVYLGPVAVLATAWLVLDTEATPRTWLTLYFARLVRDASGELLPFSSLGGFVFGARAAILGGVNPALAISTTVVDVTAEFIGQLGFAALGLALLGSSPSSRLDNQELLSTSLLGLAAAAIGAVGFIMLQRPASAFIERMVARRAPHALAQTSAVTASLHALYQRPIRLTASIFLHFAAWVFGAFTIWLALHWAGIDRFAHVTLTLRRIIGLESLVYAVRSLTFFVPMGLGAIESGYAVVGLLFHLPLEFCMALSLIKRARDILIGLPALALWQFLEGRRLVLPGVRAKPPPAEPDGPAPPPSEPSAAPASPE